MNAAAARKLTDAFGVNMAPLYAMIEDAAKGGHGGVTIDLAEVKEKFPKTFGTQRHIEYIFTKLEEDGYEVKRDQGDCRDYYDHLQISW